MNVADFPQLAAMTVPEKIVFLEDLWDSISRSEQNVSMPERHRQELDRRYAEYRNNPGILLGLEGLQRKIADRI
jgi:putative addiction module component (TIGR02574 family)